MQKEKERGGDRRPANMPGQATGGQKRKLRSAFPLTRLLFRTYIVAYPMYVCTYTHACKVVRCVLYCVTAAARTDRWGRVNRPTYNIIIMVVWRGSVLCRLYVLHVCMYVRMYSTYNMLVCLLSPHTYVAAYAF